MCNLLNWRPEVVHFIESFGVHVAVIEAKSPFMWLSRIYNKTWLTYDRPPDMSSWVRGGGGGKMGWQEGMFFFSEALLGMEGVA